MPTQRFPEVNPIRKAAPVQLILHSPQNPESRKKLALRVSEVHAAAVVYQIQRLNCAASRKKALLAAVPEKAANKSRKPP